MDKLLKTSIKAIEKFNFQKYGWVITTASVIALIIFQRGKDDGDDFKSKKNCQNNQQGQNKQEQQQKEQQQKQQNKNQQNEENYEDIQKSEQQQKQIASSQTSKNKTNSQNNMKDQKFQQVQQNLKKQMQELDKKTKKSNPSSLTGSLLKMSKSRYNSRQFDQEQGYPQSYAQSDFESRQNVQIRNQITLKKQRKYVTDIDEPANSYKRNQILKIAKDQNPNDGLFFQMLASLAENEDENE
ncbi:hypothetical protein ABPG74_014858 [Tetrahymena malaccensis]